MRLEMLNWMGARLVVSILWVTVDSVVRTLVMSRRVMPPADGDNGMSWVMALAVSGADLWTGVRTRVARRDRLSKNVS